MNQTLQTKHCPAVYYWVERMDMGPNSPSRTGQRGTVQANSFADAERIVDSERGPVVRGYRKFAIGYWPTN